MDNCKDNKKKKLYRQTVQNIISFEPKITYF